MKNFKRLFIIVVTIVVVTGLAAYFYLETESPQVVYSTEPVRVGNIEDVVLTNGVLYPDKLVNVGAQVSGRLELMAVRVGDKVKEGDLIAQIDHLSQENALKEAKASLAHINAQYRAKQAQITQAELAFERQKQMLLKNATFQSAYEAAETQLLVYRAELEQLSAEKEKALISVDDAKLDLGYTTINSPTDGTVVYVSVEEGQTVNTNQSTPSIVEVAQLDTMTIKAQVSEADIIHVSPGQKVYFSILGAPDGKFFGTLKTIEPGPTLLTGDDNQLKITDSDAIYYNALFDVENADNVLRIGMTAQVSIVLDSAQDALLIPAQVLSNKLPGKNQYRIPVLVNDQVEMRRVEIGINNKVYAQVISGLEQGEQVVIGQAGTGGPQNQRMTSALRPEQSSPRNGGRRQ